MSNLDQIALDIINEWGNRRYTNYPQKKAALQALIIEALKTCGNDALDEAVKVAESGIDEEWPNDDLSNHAKEIAETIKELKQ